MGWVVTVCARGGDVDLACSRRLGPSSLGRLNDEGEALTGRRRYAFGRAMFIVERLVGTGSLGAKHVHGW